MAKPKKALRHIESAQAQLVLAAASLAPRMAPDRGGGEDESGLSDEERRRLERERQQREPPDRDPPEDRDERDERRDPPPPPPPSRDPGRGRRRNAPPVLTDKYGYPSGWGNSGDCIYLKPNHQLIAKEERGVHLMSNLSRVRLRPGYRSGLMTSMKDTDTRYALWLTDSEISPAELNGPNEGWAGTGTRWAARMYGVHSGLLSNLRIRYFFGDSYADDEVTSQEGHAFYLTLAQTPGALLRLEDLDCETQGAHPVHFVTAFGGRAGNAPPPQMGGRVEVDHCDFLDTDICPHRGAYSISMTDVHAAVTVSNSNIVQGGPRLKAAGSTYDVYRSRGLIAAEGVQESLTLTNNYWGAEAPSDRLAQVWIQGPEVVTMSGNTFDCQVVSINHPYNDNENTVHTKKFVFKDNKGNARVEWKGQFLGIAHELNGEWTL